MHGEHEGAHGEGLLARISNEMVRTQKHYFGKGPTQARSYMLDDMLFIVMRGGLTAAEKTMLEFGYEDLVRQFRQAFENAMTENLTGMIEELTGRKVVNYQSQVLFDPDLIVEIFVFDSAGAGGHRAATAEAQLRDDDTGKADTDALDQPSGNGD